MRLYGHDNNWLTTAENRQETPQIASSPWHEHQIDEITVDIHNNLDSLCSQRLQKKITQLSFCHIILCDKMCLHGDP